MEITHHQQQQQRQTAKAGNMKAKNKRSLTVALGLSYTGKEIRAN